VVLDSADSAAERYADHYGDPQAAAGAEVHLCDLADDLVITREHETVELDLAHGPVAAQCQPDRRADDPGLGEWGVDHPVLTEVLLQAIGHAENPAQLADILSHDQNLGVALHRPAEARVDRLTQRHLRHRCASSVTNDAR
jgi:hypothetical protein